MQVKDLQMKRVFRTVLLVLLLNVVGIGKIYAWYDFSAVCESGQTLYYNITDATNHYVALICPGVANPNTCWSGFTRPFGNFILPTTVEHGGVIYSITSIGDYAFYACTDLRGNLTIPNSVTSIGERAFEGCTLLMGILTIGDSVITIGNSAFENCSGFDGLLTIPNSVTSIGDKAFYGCSGLNAITIPNSLTMIVGNAFDETGWYIQQPNGILYLDDWCLGYKGEKPVGILDLNENTIGVADFAFFGCSGLTGSLVIPETMTYIGSQAFGNCISFTGSLTIGNSVMSIGTCAFYNCSGFTGSLTIPNSVTTIGSSAFYGCNGFTGSLTIPNSVTTIADGVFSGCNGFTGSLTIPNSVTTIGTSAFAWCNGFTGSLTIPNSVTTIGTSAFEWCNGFTGSLTIGNSVTTIDSFAFMGCSGFTGSLTIPNSVITIADRAFSGCNGFTGSLTIGNSVTTIGSFAFMGCSGFTGSLTIPNSVITIADRAFSGCNGFTGSLTIPNSVTTIGSSAFFECSNLSSLTIGEGMTSIGERSFQGCVSLTSVTVLNSVTSIDSFAFFGCSNLSSLTIGEGVTSIGESSFQDCVSLTSVIVPNSVTSIGSMAFYGCSNLSSLFIGEGVTSIGGYAFWDCPLLQTVYYNAINCYAEEMNTSFNSEIYSVFSSDDIGSASAITRVVFGSNVYRIPNYAFKDAENIYQRLVIPASVTEIGNYAFYGCSSIPLMAIQGSNLVAIGEYAFYGCSSIRSSLVIPDSVNTIGQYAFFGCTQLPSLIIGEGVTSVGGYAFWNCPALQTVSFNAINCLTMYTRTGTGTTYSPYGYYSVFNAGTSYSGSLAILNLTIGENVQRIPEYAFKNCSNAQNILVLPDTLQFIGDYAFYGCSSLSGALTIPDAVNSIGEYAFYNCSGFNGELTIGSSLSQVKQYSFYGCNGLTSLNIGNNVTSIGDYAFYGCNGFTGTLIIPDSVTTIGEYAFYYCSGFTGHMIIPNLVTTIGNCAFNGCSRISELTIGEGVNSIGTLALYCSSLNTIHFNAVNCTNMSSGTGSNGSNVFGGFLRSVTMLTIGDNVTRIPAYAFKDIKYALPIGGGSYHVLPSSPLIFPNSLTYIGDYAFYGCSSFIGDLVIPNEVTYIGNHAFDGCTNFNGSLTIGNSVETIGLWAFNYCLGLTGSLIIGRNLSTIGDNAFRNCGNITSLISENPTPPTAFANSFGMNYSIPVHVPYGAVTNYQSATGWSRFTNYKEQCVFDQLDNDNWSDEMNWYAMELPTENDVVCINSNCHLDMDANVLHLYVYNFNDALTINSGKTLMTTYGIGTVQASQLVVADGGQLVNPFSNAYGTVQKHINGYGSTEEGWYTVASPIYDGMVTSELAIGSYDLYAYDEHDAMWLNHKGGTFTKLNTAQGYLYANQTEKVLNFSGQLNASNSEISIPVTYSNGEVAGFNLVGNPYTNNISITNLKINDMVQTLFYRAEGNNNLVAYVAEDNEPIKVGEGFFVKVFEDGILTFDASSTRGDSQLGNYVRLVLSQNDYSTGLRTIVADHAYLSMNEGTPFEKICIESNTPRLFFERDGNRYAVVDNEASGGTLALFLENANGSCTIEATLLNAELNYLHLLDNLTGDDIDLLETPSYTFEASASDNVSRFKLVYKSR